MKITKSYLKQVIKEEIEKIEEIDIPMGGRGHATKDLGMGVKRIEGPLPGVESEFNTRVEQIRKVAEKLGRADFKLSPAEQKEIFTELMIIFQYMFRQLPMDPSGSVD